MNMNIRKYIKEEPSRNPMKELHGDEFFEAWDKEFGLEPIGIVHNKYKYKIIISDDEMLCTLKEDVCNGDYCDECFEEKHDNNNM